MLQYFGRWHGALQTKHVVDEQGGPRVEPPTVIERSTRDGIGEAVNRTASRHRFLWRFDSRPTHVPLRRAKRRDRGVPCHPLHARPRARLPRTTQRLLDAPSQRDAQAKGRARPCRPSSQTSMRGKFLHNNDLDSGRPNERRSFSSHLVANRNASGKKNGGIVADSSPSAACMSCPGYLGPFAHTNQTVNHKRSAGSERVNHVHSRGNHSRTVPRLRVAMRAFLLPGSRLAMGGSKPAERAIRGSRERRENREAARQTFCVRDARKPADDRFGRREQWRASLLQRANSAR